MYQPTIVSPSIISFAFKNSLINCFCVKIESKEYQLCEETSRGEKYWANSKKGTYGRGIGRTDDDPYKPVRTGLLGEFAFSKVFGTKVDLEYKKGGDHHDTLLGGLTIDLKTAMKNYGAGLIYQQNQWKKIIPLKSDLYVFAFIHHENREDGWANVRIVGYLTQEEVKKCPIKPARKGFHFNYEVEYDKVRPIGELYDNYIEKRKEEQEQNNF